jgi:transcriptional regulator with XRE-family HTH domain
MVIMANGGKEKLAPVVSGEYIRKLRISLGLTQLQFAKLMEVGNVTVANWEKNGLDGTKSSSFSNFKYLTTLLKQSMRHPELVSPQKLMRYLKLASNHELMPYYLPYLGEMETDYLNVINSGSLAGVLFALLFDKELERRGVPSPSDDAEKGLEDLLGPTSAEDTELLEAIDRESKAGERKRKDSEKNDKK